MTKKYIYLLAVVLSDLAIIPSAYSEQSDMLNKVEIVLVLYGDAHSTSTEVMTEKLEGITKQATINHSKGRYNIEFISVIHDPDFYIMSQIPENSRKYCDSKGGSLVFAVNFEKEQGFGSQILLAAYICRTGELKTGAYDTFAGTDWGGIESEIYPGKWGGVWSDGILSFLESNDVLMKVL